MDAPSTENQGIQSDPLYACGWSFQDRVEVHTKAPRSFTSTLTSTPLCRSSCLHPHLMTYPVEVYFASNANIVIFLMTAKLGEVMRNTSGTAPDFPNVELKSADSMFLALILYLYHLSWQRKDGSMKWTSILPINLNNFFDVNVDSDGSSYGSIDHQCPWLISYSQPFYLPHPP